MAEPASARGVSMMQRLAVGFVAVLSSMLPIAELGLFGYETFLAEEAEDDRRDASFQDLMAFQAQIDLHATQASLLPDGSERAQAYQRTEDAVRVWENAFEKWRAGDYDAMFFTAQQGRAQLREQAYVEEDAPWADAVEAPGFPWLVLSATFIVAAASWMGFAALRHRRQDG